MTKVARVSILSHDMYAWTLGLFGRPNNVHFCHQRYVHQTKYDTTIYYSACQTDSRQLRHLCKFQLQRKISLALKAERDVGIWRGRWGTESSNFFADQISYLKKGSRLCHQHYYRPLHIFRPSNTPFYSLVCTNQNAWTSIFMFWQKGLVWLQAVCTCPQKAIVVLQKFLLKWIPCKKSK